MLLYDTCYARERENKKKREKESVREKDTESKFNK